MTAVTRTQRTVHRIAEAQVREILELGKGQIVEVGLVPSSSEPATRTDLRVVIEGEIPLSASSLQRRDLHGLTRHYGHQVICDRTGISSRRLTEIRRGARALDVDDLLALQQAYGHEFDMRATVQRIGEKRKESDGG